MNNLKAKNKKQKANSRGFTPSLENGIAPNKIGARKSAMPFFSAGFTLIETLTALTILSLSIVGLLVVTSQGIANANLAKNKLIATHLSAESVEILRNMRDSRGWAEFITATNDCDVSQNLNGCIIDSSSIISSSDKWMIDGCSELDCVDRPIYFDPSVVGGFYTHIPSGEKTPFFRVVKTQSMQANGDEIKITSQVWWYQGSVRKSVTLGENLFNWQ